MSAEEQGEFKVYFRRWWMLLMFSFMIVSNATMWVTFAPISNIAEDYFGEAGTTTNVNMLAIVFLILYPVGTLLEVQCMKKYKLRGTLLAGGALSALGAMTRVFAAINPSDHPDWVYIGMLLGQMLAALAQPMFMNCPASLSAAWFPPSERDISTALGSLSSALGNAAGSVVPVLFVSANYTQEENNKGMLMIMLVELLICIVSLVSVYLYFEARPPTAPSYSAMLKNGGSAKTDLRDSVLPSVERIDSDAIADLVELSSNHSGAQWASTLDQLGMLYRNSNYCLLFISFVLGLGIFTALMTLINQIVEPYGYSNDEAGSFSAVLLVSGLLGAAVSSKLLESTKAYETVLKTGFITCLFAFALLISQLRADNFGILCSAFAITGFGLMPMLPATIENTAECTFPEVSEDLAVGLLFMGGNIVGVAFCTFTQSMLKKEMEMYGEDSNAVSPFLRSSNILLLSSVMVAVIMLMFYKGDYKRMQADRLHCHEERRMVSSEEPDSIVGDHTRRNLRAPLLGESSMSSSKAAFSQRETINYNIGQRGEAQNRNVDALKTVLRDSEEAESD